MFQALEAPLFKMVAVAGAALAFGAVLHAKAPSPNVHRLVLDAPVFPHALYLTAWRNGDILVAIDPEDEQQITITTRATLSDGCRWLGRETLMPIDTRHYAYFYDETILSCDPDAVPAQKTPRVGVVTVAD